MTRQEMLAEVRQALESTMSQEVRLAHRQEQFEQMLARSAEYLERARRLNDRAMALDALARRQEVEEELARLEQRWDNLNASRAALLQQERSLLGQRGQFVRLPAHSARPADSPLYSARPPAQPELAARPLAPPVYAPQPAVRPVYQAPPAAPMPLAPLMNEYAEAFAPVPERADNKLFMLLCGLAAVVVMVPLLLWLGFRAPPATQNPPTTSLPTATPTTALPQPSIFTPSGTAPTSRDCRDMVSFPCYNPEQIQGAYHLNALYKQGYDGRGQTIVILGVGHTTTLKQDLHAFDQAWGLPDPPSFQILQPQGAPVPYTCSSGEDDLEAENTLDVEWSHAMAPGANIVLVIWSNGARGNPPAFNCGFRNIEGAVAYALDHQLGKILSISYGGSELDYSFQLRKKQAAQPESYAQAHEIFQRAAAEHVTVLAAAGDTGPVNIRSFLQAGPQIQDVSWPASDPYVLAVGGTSIQITDANGTVESEQTWNDQSIGATGGGISAVFAEPEYQHVITNQQMLFGKRGLPDVAFPAALSFALYLSSTTGLGPKNPQWRHWTVTGGTSASAPCWAGMIALANQMAGSPLGFIQPALYALRGQGFNDVTQGNNTFAGVKGYSAQVGYDLVTGWGTPIADQLLPALIKQAGSL